MIQKMKQRLFLSLLLIAAMVIVPVSSSQAQVRDLGEGGGSKTVQIGGGGTVDPQYVNTLTITADLSIKGSTAYVFSNVVAKRVCTVTVVMRLQHKENGAWKTKKSWITASDRGYVGMEKTATLTQRGDYRTYALFNVAGEELSYKSVVLGY